MFKKNYLHMLYIFNKIVIGYSSIAGITYKDDFDNEERYRHVECNPLYWHPLHMPDHCLKSYEDLIRENLGDTSLNDFGDPYNFQLNTDINIGRIKLSNVEVTAAELYPQFRLMAQPPISMNYPDTTYMEMLKMMQADASAVPGKPVLGVLPNLGMATFYRQPVSKRTTELIYKVSKDYSDSARATYNDVADRFMYQNQNPEPNIADTAVNKLMRKIKKNSDDKSKKSVKSKPKVKKIVNGNSVAYIFKQ